MNKAIHFHSDRKVVALLLLSMVSFVVLTITQDLLRSNLHQSAFYFFESFIFSSFWWLFAPMWFAQYLYLQRNAVRQLSLQVFLLILVPIVTHLLTYPAVVWLISNISYYHTYAFAQTLRFELSEHLYLLIACYSIPAWVFNGVRSGMQKKADLSSRVTAVVTAPSPALIALQAVPISPEVAPTPIDSMLVSDGTKKLVIPVSEVVYFSAKPPYVEIHLPGKKYLHHETLKSLTAKLDPDKFVRVHKSTIVKIDMVVSCMSRSNGDYDLRMRNGVSLRLSRNFAACFNLQFGNGHRVTAK